MKKAFLTGINGQDGSYLAELLLTKHYEVWGMVRRSSNPNLSRIEGLNIKLIEGDMTDPLSLANALRKAKPDEIYNLAAQSHVGTSFEQPSLTMEVNGMGVRHLLEATHNYRPNARVYQASTSEMFGKVLATPQNEETPFNPISPYGHAKLYAHYTVRQYRETKGLFACSGILFNHESPRRGENFVTRKIAKGVADIKRGKLDKLRLGNLESVRDWGHARDYVKAMWMMLQQDKPEDFVIATGQTHSVKEFCQTAFARVGLDWNDHVVIDPQFFRPADVVTLCGDATKAKEKLGWEPETEFAFLVEEMVEAEMNR